MSAATLPEAGTIIGGRYRLARPIGSGGMGTIWEAEHLTLGSTVAVKFLRHVGPPQSEASQRFVREARVSAAIKHRNVVDILDFGLTEGSHQPYMVMERLEGGPLADHMRAAGPLPVAEAARLVSLLLRGLSAVHDAGMVHRDLKPENVWLVVDDDGSFPKLLDFGLSRRVGRSDMTGEGMLVGTPDYMSPEQASGASDLEARADLYSVGVILYELVTGRLPFERRSTIELIDAVLHAPAIPLRKYRPDAPDWLVSVVERAMCKDRNARFATARQMRSALAEGEPGMRLSAESGLIMLSEYPPPPLGTLGPDEPTAPRGTWTRDEPSDALLGPRPPAADRGAEPAPDSSTSPARGGDDTLLAPTRLGVTSVRAPVIARRSVPDRGDHAGTFALTAREPAAPGRSTARTLLLLLLLFAAAAGVAWALDGTGRGLG